MPIYEVDCCRNIAAGNKQLAIEKFVKSLQGENNLDDFNVEENDDWEEGDDLII